jgi:Holliday junction resolvasome RuvABC endonuclease subunit
MTTPRIVGLDLSFTKAGIAYPDGRTAVLRAPTSAGGRTPYERLYRHATNVVANVRLATPDLVVVEDYAPNSKGALATIRGAEVGGFVRASLWRLAIPFELIRPNELKAFATGRGNADKAAMIGAAIDRGARTDVDDDEADAYLLRAMALETITARATDDERDRFSTAGRP